MNIKKTVVSLFVLAVAVSSSTAFAGKVNYAGSSCVQRSGSPVRYDFHGAVYNNSTTQESWVLCHVPHTDFDGFLNAGEIDGGWFRAVDKNNGRDVKCRFRRQGINNNGSISAQYGAMGSTSGFGTQGQGVNLSGVGEAGHTGYVLACEIPRRTGIGTSKVYTYQVRQ